MSGDLCVLETLYVQLVAAFWDPYILYRLDQRIELKRSILEIFFVKQNGKKRI